MPWQRKSALSRKVLLNIIARENLQESRYTGLTFSKKVILKACEACELKHLNVTSDNTKVEVYDMESSGERTPCKPRII